MKNLIYQLSKQIIQTQNRNFVSNENRLKSLRTGDIGVITFRNNLFKDKYDLPAEFYLLTFQVENSSLMRFRITDFCDLIRHPSIFNLKNNYFLIKPYSFTNTKRNLPIGSIVSASQYSFGVNERIDMRLVGKSNQLGNLFVPLYKNTNGIYLLNKRNSINFDW
ncbi:hypothetical protein [Halobacteriovorax sp. DA5]|uniref:hypothetical protein n=1 Tax=Halobacteriovorax sp. DA5 TaxID=2067553 RepID=UPI000CD312D3|nr:hypothetical protein [Halobacteriovorax sp. DA5]POB13857.1 hypothetical protein C0Z22_07295 [Halobacteriovorax sp. DA5]